MDSTFAKKIKLNQLRLVSAIDRHRQISVAAREMAITQPAASRMLLEIERMLGVPLFDRQARGMEPTVYGQALAARANRLLLNLGDMGSELQGLKQAEAGAVSVGAVTGAALGVVLPAIEALRADVPKAEVQINVETSPILLRQLQEGLCDFVLARVSGEVDVRALEVLPARMESVCLLVREGHPLARKRKVSLQDLSNQQWVAQTHTVPIRQALDRAFLECGAPLPANMTSTTSLLVILAILSSSDAIAPVASEVAALLTSNEVGARLKVLPLDIPIQVSPYFLVKLKSRTLSPLAQRLMSLVAAGLDES